MPPRRPADGSKTVGHADYAAAAKAGLQPRAASSPKVFFAASGRPWSWTRNGSWRWVDPAAATLAAGTPPRLASEYAKLVAENAKLKLEKQALVNGRDGAAAADLGPEDADGDDVYMAGADAPTKEDVAACRKQLESLQSLLANDSSEASAMVLRQHEEQLAEMVRAQTQALPLGKQRSVVAGKLKKLRRSHEHYDTKRLPAHVSKIAELEDTLAEAKRVQLVDLKWFDELPGKIAALEREVEQLDAATVASGGPAAVRGPQVGASSVLDLPAAVSAFDDAMANLSEHPAALQELQTLRGRLNQAVVAASPPAPSPSPTPSFGAAEPPAAAQVEPAESVVSSIDGLDDLSDADDYD